MTTHSRVNPFRLRAILLSVFTWPLFLTGPIIVAIERSYGQENKETPQAAELREIPTLENTKAPDKTLIKDPYLGKTRRSLKKNGEPIQSEMNTVDTTRSNSSDPTLKTNFRPNTIEEKTARAQSAKGKTAEHQSIQERNVDTTRRIRQEIMSDSALSSQAHNVKIITENGRITLRGPVSSAKESNTIISIAKRVSPNSTIVNETFVQ